MVSMVTPTIHHQHPHRLPSSKMTQIVDTNKDFRHIYRQIFGTTKHQSNLRDAYQMFSCCGKTIVKERLVEAWPLDTDRVSVDRLHDIYQKLENLYVVDEDVGKVNRLRLTPQDVMDTLSDEIKNLDNEKEIEKILHDFTGQHGMINFREIVECVEQTKSQLLQTLLGKSVCSPSIGENIELHHDLDQKKEELIVMGPQTHLSLKVGGFLSISPILQSISYRVETQDSITCEIVLSLGNNSDVPTGHFDNDLFLLISNSEKKIIGITRFRLKQRFYSTGSVQLEPRSEITVIAMGTSFSRRKSTREKIALLDGNARLTKRLKLSLMNIFESFDIDKNGVLDGTELNFYTQASGDQPLTSEDIQLYMANFDNRDGGLTLEGFLSLHQTEASEGGDHVVSDFWHSLNYLGYDSELQSIYGCSYDISIFSDQKITLIPKLIAVSRNDRTFLLQSLYDLGVEQTDCELRPRLFQTDYFGLMIAKKEEKFLSRKFKLIIDEQHNIRLNLPHRVNEEISLRDSDCEWVLIASYTTRNDEFDIKMRLVEIH